MQYKPIIGLEVHVQLNTKTKLFCSCSAKYGSEPNTNVCPVCLGFPGAMPYLNEEALKKAVLIGLTLNCKVSSKTVWDRKHYIYPDLFNGYQISQLQYPVNIEGNIDIEYSNNIKNIRINRAHLENDAAKSIHVEDAYGENSYTLIDGNESGMPLVEIVSEPDMSTAEEAVAFAKKIRELVRWSGASECDMEKSQMRFDINVSIDVGNNKHTPITEVKNRNSFAELEAVINYEYERQVKQYEETKEVYSHGKKTTRGWDGDKNQTFIMRTKEEANDYRYFPEPDIPTIFMSNEFVENIRASMPLPKSEVVRKLIDMGLDAKQIDVLIEDRKKLDFFYNTLKIVPSIEAKKISNWIVGDIEFILSQNGLLLENTNFQPIHLSQLLKLIDDKKISNTNAKIVVEKLILEKIDDNALDAFLSQYLIEDNSDALSSAVDKVIQNNTEVVKQIQEGKETAKQFLVGLVMRELKGKADPLMIKELINEKL